MIATGSSDSIIAGFKYTGTLKTMNLEAGGRFGNSQVLIKKIDRILLHLYRSMGGKYGFEDTNLYNVEYPDSASGYFTGDSKALDYDSNPGEEQHIIIKKDDPTQFNLLGITMRGMTED